MCWKNIWKFLGDFLLVPYFQIKLNGCLSLGDTTPISFWAQIYFFLAVIHLFDIAYLSKCLIHMEDACKMLNDMPKVERGRGYCVGATNSRDLSFYTYII